MSAREADDLVRLLSVLPTLYPRGDAWLHRRLADVARGDAQCRVVTFGGEICGAAILTPKRPRITKLSTLYVAPAARRRGLGSDLIDEVLRDLDGSGNQEVYVTVAHHLSGPLTTLLRPRGFTATALEYHRYGLDRHELVLSRIAT